MKIIKSMFLSGFLIAYLFLSLYSIGMEDDDGDKRFASSTSFHQGLLKEHFSCDHNTYDDAEINRMDTSFQVIKDLENMSIVDNESLLLLQRFPEDIWRKALSLLEDFQDILRFSCVSREAYPLCLEALDNAPELYWQWVGGPPIGTLSNYSWNKRIQQALSIALIMHRDRSNYWEQSSLSDYGQDKKKIDVGQIKSKHILHYANDIQLMYGLLNPLNRKSSVVKFFEQVYLKVSAVDRVVSTVISFMDDLLEKDGSFSPKTNKDDTLKECQELIEDDVSFLNELMQLGIQEKQLLVFWDYIANRNICETHRYFKEYNNEGGMVLVQRFILSNNLRKELESLPTGKELAAVWNKIIEYGIDITLNDLRSAANANIKTEDYQCAATFEDKILKIKGHKNSDWLYAGRANFLAKNFYRAAEIYNFSYGDPKKKKLFELKDLSYAAKLNFQIKNYKKAIEIFDESAPIHDKYLYSSLSHQNRYTPEQDMKKKLLISFYHRLEDLIFSARASFLINDYKGSCIKYGQVLMAQIDFERKLGLKCDADLLIPVLTLSDLQMARQANISENNRKAVSQIFMKILAYSRKK